jgi:hypothetical protein
MIFGADKETIISGSDSEAAKLLTIWECQTRDETRLAKKLRQFLNTLTAL